MVVGVALLRRVLRAMSGLHRTLRIALTPAVARIARHPRRAQ